MSTNESPEARMRALLTSPGAPAPSARERILAEAFVLFYAEGIRAVGVDLLIARSGVAKATFYRHFASKNDLVVAYLERRRSAWLTWLTSDVAERPASGDERLLAVFDALADLFADPAFRGCPVHNAVVEAGGDSPAVLEQARLHQGDLERYVAGLATEAGPRDVDEITRQWVLLIDGALVGAQRGGGSEPARTARRVAERFFSGCGTPSVG
jgi:AcrR family transcriptional regulator